MIVMTGVKQYSPKWRKARLGIPTASQFFRIVDTSGNPSKSRTKYLSELATEAITGVLVGNNYQSYAMKKGHEKEADARSLFEMIQEVEVAEVGLCYKNTQKKYSMSPDGLMENTGLEIFSPECWTHIECLRHPHKSIAIASKFQQIQGSLFISGFDYYWFMVYYPGLAPLIQRVSRNEEFIGKLDKELETFVFDLSRTIKELEEMAGGL